MPLQTSMRDLKYRIASLFFVLVIVAGVGFLLYPILSNVLYQLNTANLMTSYNRAVANYSPEQLDQMWADAYAYNEELGNPIVRDPFAYEEIVSPLDRYFDILNPDGTGMIGYVEVPSAGINIPIYHATTNDVLEKGAGHIATTAFPIDGDSIHPIITGHTGLPDKLLFTNLTVVKVGDVFRIRVLDKTFSYKVDSIEVIEPTDVTKLQPVEGENHLTLLTCTPYGINSHRLLVTGSPTEEDVPQNTRGVSLDVLPWFVAFCLLVIAAMIADLLIRRRAKKLRSFAAGKRIAPATLKQKAFLSNDGKGGRDHE